MEIAPYTLENEAAAKAFNDRMRARNQTEFLLSERAIGPGPEASAIRDLHFLAQEDGVVRGGFLLARYPACFAWGEETIALNAREPLSEGLIDPKYSLLALRLLKHMQLQGKYLFALGMGSEQARFTRLLKGAGWTIRPVPFFFLVLRAGPFLTELQMLRTSAAKRLLAQVSALTGAGKLGISALQFRSVAAKFATKRLTLERVNDWEDWADQLWRDFQPHCSFTVKRDRATLKELYRIGEDRTEVFLIRQQHKPVAWIAALNSKMSGHKFFGNMQVATILDGVAPPDLMPAALALAAEALKQEGADLLVSNQSHAAWIQGFRQAGFLSSRSNYILATNKALSDEIAKQSGGFEAVHFTRGDSDGRGHL